MIVRDRKLKVNKNAWQKPLRNTNDFAISGNQKTKIGKEVYFSCTYYQEVFSILELLYLISSCKDYFGL